MARRLLSIFALMFTGLAVWTVYVNVISSDAPIRADAERVARERAGCGSACKLVRMEGSRGVLNEQLQITFEGKPPVLIQCSRPYVAFGASTCR